MKRENITIERLKKLVSYDQETGEFTTIFRTPLQKRSVIGNVVGRIDTVGYLVTGLDRKIYRLHRLAWFYVYGKWPEKNIDHINGIKTDNRIFNLRDVPQVVNSQNLKKARPNSITGLLGVTSPKNKERFFRAHIRANGKRNALGAFDTAQEAHEAYVAAKRRLHAGCTI